MDDIKHNAYNLLRFIYKRLPVPGFIRAIIWDIRLHIKAIFGTKSYIQWITQNEPTDDCLQAQRQYVFTYRPKISIVVPTYNTPTGFFVKLFNSVKAQTYDNWELCIADGSSVKNEEISKLCRLDDRVKYLFLGENKGISGNTNEAINLTEGGYIGLADHDDTLAPFALFEIAKCINEHPEAELIYSDEDVTFGNRRLQPHFKPDFAPDTLRSGNYICHFTIIKRELLKQLGGLKSEYDGSQDYDLVLRASELTAHIRHIPKILYHWRHHKNSFSKTSDIPYTAAVNAIQSHIDRLGLDGLVRHNNRHHLYEIIYRVIGNPSVSILIPNCDQINLLRQCIKSILELTTYNNYEIVIIENNSQENDTFAYYHELKKLPEVRIIYYPETSFNYSKLINYGVKNSASDYILQLNNDMKLLTPNWLELMIGFAQRPDIGAVGARLYSPNMKVQHAGNMLQTKGAACCPILYRQFKNTLAYMDYNLWIHNLTAVTGACMMSRRELYEYAGYMDENQALALDYADVDFCMTIRAMGLLIVYNPLVELIRYKSRNGSKPDSAKKITELNQADIYFKNKWKNELNTGDLYFNENITKV